MKKKLLGFFVCTLVFLLLFVPMISVIGTPNQVNIENGIQAYSNSNPLSGDQITMILYPAPGFIGVNLDITNTGLESMENVEWSFRSKAAIAGTGLFIREKLEKGSVDVIQPDETITIQFRPLNKNTPSPIGLGNLYMNASIHFENSSVRTQQRAVILFFFLLGFKETYMDIKPPEAYSMFLNDTFDLIIDVVGLDIYSLGHLPGAVNYIWADGTLNQMIPSLDKNNTYLVYCHTDPPSTSSAQALINAGIMNTYRLEGNFRAWKDGGYPIETGG